MLLAILLIAIIGIMFFIFVGAIFFFAWSVTIILAVLVVFFHKKYRKWQNAVPSDTQTQETIDVKTKRYKTGRTVTAVLLVIALVLSIRFSYWIVEFNTNSSETTNSESVSVEGRLEESADSHFL